MLRKVEIVRKVDNIKSIVALVAFLVSELVLGRGIFY